jgi:hypothetical protein
MILLESPWETGKWNRKAAGLTPFEKAIRAQDGKPF